MRDDRDYSCLFLPLVLFAAVVPAAVAFGVAVAWVVGRLVLP